MSKKLKNLMFVIYDGIQNSIFSSQVLSPILNELESNKIDKAILVSFENQKIDPELLKKLIPAHSKLKVEIFYKNSKLGPLNLFLDSKKLKQLIQKEDLQNIIARGPFAGLISLKALVNSSKKPNLKIQARGLCAEERKFSKQFQKNSLIGRIKEFIAFKYLKAIERAAFGNRLHKNYKGNLTIEAVSSALAEFLEKEYKTKIERIIIAQKDIPQKIASLQAISWRDEIREQLGISKEASVYCYSGSAKPWQCSRESIEFFSKKYAENKNSFLLILTTEIEKFNSEIAKYSFPASAYKVLNVKPTDVYKYLSAADIGLLFRHADIINWVSRPTKMLEYQAVGLKIEHNNTIQILADLDKQSSNCSVK